MSSFYIITSLFYSSLLLFVLIQIVLLVNGCNAASDRESAIEDQSTKMMPRGHKRKLSKRKSQNSNNILTNYFGNLVRSNNLEHGASSSSSGIKKAKYGNQSFHSFSAKIDPKFVQKIRQLFSLDDSAGNISALNEEDESAIRELTDIFELMPEEWQKNRERKLFSSALISKIAFNRLMSLNRENVFLIKKYWTELNENLSEEEQILVAYDKADEKLVNKILIFFALADDDVNFNPIENLKEKIKIVKNAIKFYEFEKDKLPNGFNINRKWQKLKLKMVNGRKQMNAFESWLQKVQQKIVEGMKTKKEKHKIGEEILKSMYLADSPFFFNDEEEATINGAEIKQPHLGETAKQGQELKKGVTEGQGSTNFVNLYSSEKRPKKKIRVNIGRGRGY